MISALELVHRLPEIVAVVQTYLPALGLQDEPRLAAQLVELAALARGERPPQILAHLREHRLEMLVDGALDLPSQQRTLRAAITRSYDLLDEAQRGLFRSLGVFVGGCDLHALAAVSAWNEAAISSRSTPTR